MELLFLTEKHLDFLLREHWMCAMFYSACKENCLYEHYNRKFCMTKEVVKHRKDEKKKPMLTAKEKKAKKQEKKMSKG